MQRRTFIKKSGSGLMGAGLALSGFADVMQDQVIGHGDFRYKIDLNWGALNASYYPVKDCHEMVEDSQGRLILLTNETQNNVIIYDKSGKLLETWGSEYPGAHGLTLKDEGGEDFLYIADNNRHEVIKTDLKGKVILTIPYPKASGKYDQEESYVPTETTIADNGDIYVADGYGSQYIMHYDAKGELKNIFGGRGEEEHHFSNAHGICIDRRGGTTPTLLITDRMANKLKRFSMSGKYLETIHLPGAFICRPVIKDEQVYLATIWSGEGSEGTGFVSILDESNRIISAPGGTTPGYEAGSLTPIRQALKIFRHPHDVCVDRDDNLYVPQWNAFGAYPIKLNRV